MTPYLNEDYDQMHTKMDMVLVNMWPWAGAGWPWERRRRLERGMVVTFRYLCSVLYIYIYMFCCNGVVLTGDLEKIPRKPNPYRY